MSFKRHLRWYQNTRHSLWKCLAKNEEIDGWMAIMMSLPFIHGFLNNLWTRVIEVMLEKNKEIGRSICFG